MALSKPLNLLKNKMMTKKLLLFILIVIIMACINDDNIGPDKIGEVTALKNGIEWSANIYNFGKSLPFDIGFSMGIKVYNNKGFLREDLYFYRFQNHFNPQTIYLTNAHVENDSVGVFYTTLIDDGDVLGDIYDLDTTTTNNFIQITSYNSSKAEIKGIFNVSLILTRDDGDGDPPPQTIELKNGKFSVKVDRAWFE
ncbi:MAG: hypothetical protein IIC74_02980 [Bacteroidetes bacterium]|nr:hypothetical protein [Bacteroidota bacterium]